MRIEQSIYFEVSIFALQTDFIHLNSFKVIDTSFKGIDTIVL